MVQELTSDKMKLLLENTSSSDGSLLSEAVSKALSHVEEKKAKRGRPKKVNKPVV